MSQNVYDRPDFFEEYIKLSRQTKGLDGASEWPDFKQFIPDLQGKNFLDLGCGFGWYCRWARENGAIEAKGIEISHNMLAKAKEFPEHPTVTYERADLETLQLPLNSYDVIFSSLTLHYIKRLPELVKTISQALKPGGSFVFSTEHPIWTAPRNPQWIVDADGESVWPLDGYLTEGTRIRNWLADGVEKQHRTLATYLTILLDAGLRLEKIEEWGPGIELIKEMPQWANERKRPMFFFVRAIKPQ